MIDQMVIAVLTGIGFFALFGLVIFLGVRFVLWIETHPRLRIVGDWFQIVLTALCLLVALPISIVSIGYAVAKSLHWVK